MVFSPEAAAKTFKSRVFLVSISIGQACAPTLVFDVEQTRDKNVVEVFRRNGGKTGKDSIPIFEVLGDKDQVIFSAPKARTRLASVLDVLQERFMTSQGEGRSWYVPESRINDLDAAIRSEMDPVRMELLKNFTDFYDEAQSLFCDRLHDVLSSLGLGEYEPYYRSKFPGLEEIEANFGYAITQWEPMKSLEEVLEESAADSALKRSVEVLERQLKSVQEDAPRLQDEALGLLAAIASSLEEGETEKIAEKFDRINTLQDLWGGLFKSNNELISKIASDLRRALERPSMFESAAELEDEVWKLRQQWVSLSLPAHGEGAIAFSHWLYPDKGLEVKINQAQAKLSGDLTPAQRKLWEGKLANLQELLVLKLEKIKELLPAPMPALVPAPPKANPKAKSAQSSKIKEVDEAGF